MFKFLRESIKEFDHVVWPTRAETKKYFSIVVSMIIVLAVFLFAVGTILSMALFGAKDAVKPIQSTPSEQSAAPSDLKLDNLLGSGKTASGASVSLSGTQK